MDSNGAAAGDLGRLHALRAQALGLLTDRFPREGERGSLGRAAQPQLELFARLGLARAAEAPDAANCDNRLGSKAKVSSPARAEFIEATESI